MKRGFCFQNQTKFRKENAALESIETFDLESSAIKHTIENEEWLAFLQHSMEEIMNGDIESLLQEKCVAVFVSPLRNPKANGRVIEYTSYLLSLPFVLSLKEEDINTIQIVYLQANVVPNLVCAIRSLMADYLKTDMNSSKPRIRLESVITLSVNKLQAFESCVVLLCRLLYTQEEFVGQFCEKVCEENEIQLFNCLFALEGKKSRIVSDSIAILIRVLQTQIKNVEIVEKILLSYKPKGKIIIKKNFTIYY